MHFIRFINFGLWIAIVNKFEGLQLAPSHLHVDGSNNLWSLTIVLWCCPNICIFWSANIGSYIRIFLLLIPFILMKWLQGLFCFFSFIWKGIHHASWHLCFNQKSKLTRYNLSARTEAKPCQNLFLLTVYPVTHIYLHNIAKVTFVTSTACEVCHYSIRSIDNRIFWGEMLRTVTCLEFKKLVCACGFYLYLMHTDDSNVTVTGAFWPKLEPHFSKYEVISMSDSLFPKPQK